jgi:hypothetical protein
MFKVGKQMSNNLLASKILDLFEEVEGTLNAHGMMASKVGSHINLVAITRCVSNLKH